MDDQGITLMSDTVPLRPIARITQSSWIIHYYGGTQTLNKDVWEMATDDHGWTFTSLDGKIRVYVFRRDVVEIADVDFDGNCGKLEFLR